MAASSPAVAVTTPKKILLVNGSPRKDWNTGKLLKKAAEGARAAGAEAEIVHLYDITFKGCVSCFECKRIGGPNYGRCAMRDGLSELLDKVDQADALIVGSPIYFGNVTGETRSFMERALFRHFVYDTAMTTLAPKKKPVGLVFTMGVPDSLISTMGYNAVFEGISWPFKAVLGSAEVLLVTDTYQFSDYSKYETSRFDAAAKAARQRDQFPLDLEKAFDMGKRLVSQP
ncbi:flavodoxin family protein [Pelomyxa schiedti]|nr:flavodoxin family protein [Pelomyxa schiedti]